MAVVPKLEAEPGELDLVWHGGDAVSITVNVVDDLAAPVDLSAFSFVAEIRKSANDPTAFTITVDETNKATGALVLTLPIDANIPGRGVWDLRSYW